MLERASALRRAKPLHVSPLRRAKRPPRSGFHSRVQVSSCPVSRTAVREGGDHERSELAARMGGRWGLRTLVAPSPGLGMLIRPRGYSPRACCRFPTARCSFPTSFCAFPLSSSLAERVALPATSLTLPPATLVAPRLLFMVLAFICERWGWRLVGLFRCVLNLVAGFFDVFANTSSGVAAGSEDRPKSGN